MPDVEMIDVNALTLNAPKVAPVITTNDASKLVPVDDATRSKLESRVTVFVDELCAQDVNSPEFGKKVDAITAMGQKEIAVTAGQSNRFLDRPVSAMEKGSTVGTDLAALRRTIEDLDPGKKGNLLAPRRILGIVPFGSKLKNYFDSYKSAQSHISSILSRLADGKDGLLMDNAAIDTERTNLWKAMGQLQQMAIMSQTLDTKLEEKALEIEATEPAKAKAIRETALFYTRQRSQDLLTQLAVSVQGYLALDLVKRNNIELVKGVDRASTTTVSALRTAVTVAQAMTSQKIVLDQIGALNTTTANIIESTGRLMKDNTARIAEQATTAAIPMATLQQAFQNIYDTMDTIDTFKLKALDSMKLTVNTLSQQVEKSKGYIARAEGAAANNGATDETFRLEAAV